MRRLLKPALKPALKRVIQTGFRGLWSTGFSVYGAVRRPRAEGWSSDGRQRIMIVAPHPDDETIGCGGTLLRHREAGDRVVAVVVTDGRRSRAYGLGPDAMAEQRHSEMIDAAGCLDIELDWLGHPEGAWRHESVVRDLKSRLATIRPTLIYAPSRLDFHPEHRAVSVAFGEALGEDGEPRVTIRVYPIQVPFRPAMIDRIVPVGAQMARVEAALDCFRTQRGALEPTFRLRRYLGRLYRIPGGAESSWALTPRAYRALHLHPGDGGGARGMQHLAIQDPRAFLSATRLRTRLVRQSRSIMEASR